MCTLYTYTEVLMFTAKYLPDTCYLLCYSYDKSNLRKGQYLEAMAFICLSRYDAQELRCIVRYMFCI